MKNESTQSITETNEQRSPYSFFCLRGILYTPHLAWTGVFLYACSKGEEVSRRMGIIHECDNQKAITYIVWDGKVVWDDWLKHVERLNADPDWRLCPRFLADLQTVSDTSTIREEAFEQAATLLSMNRENISRKRGAVVADDEFWRARQFGSLLSEFGTSTVVFNTLDIACSYLGLDKAETRQTIRQLRAKLRARDIG